MGAGVRRDAAPPSARDRAPVTSMRHRHPDPAQHAVRRTGEHPVDDLSDGQCGRQIKALAQLVRQHAPRGDHMDRRGPGIAVDPHQPLAPHRIPDRDGTALAVAVDVQHVAGIHGHGDMGGMRPHPEQQDVERRDLLDRAPRSLVPLARDQRAQFRPFRQVRADVGVAGQVDPQLAPINQAHQPPAVRARAAAPVVLLRDPEVFDRPAAHRNSPGNRSLVIRSRGTPRSSIARRAEVMTNWSL